MLCRLCTLQTSNKINIFTHKVDDTIVLTMINKYLRNIKVKENNDEISNVICELCLSKLVNFHDFYFKVEIAQSNFFSKTGGVNRLFETLQQDENIDCEELTTFPESGDVTLLDVIDNSSIDESETENIHESEYSEMLEMVENNDDFNNSVSNLSCEAHNIDEAMNSEENCIVDESRDGSGSDFEMGSQMNYSTMYSSSEIEILNESSIGETNKKEENTIENFEFIDLYSNELAEKYHGQDLYVVDNVYIPDRFDNIIKTSRTRLECSECKVRFQYFHIYLEHMENFHKIFAFQCCEKSYRTRQNLANHITAEHEKMKQYLCNTCGLQFNSYKNSKVHWAIEHALDKDKLYDCKFCKEKFALNSLILTHRCSVVTVTRKVPSTKEAPSKRKLKYVKCNVCDASVSKTNLFRHKQKHTDAYLLICDICGKKTSRFDLNDHKKRHKGIYKKCELCNKSLKIPDSYRHHMKKHEEDRLNNVEYKCKSCDKKFMSNHLLTMHLKEDHSAENTNDCRLCHRSFETNKSLKTHITRAHTGFKCNVCDERGFISATSLQSHLLNEHNIANNTDS